MDRLILDIIEKYYPKDSALWYIYMAHANSVTSLVLKIAADNPQLKMDEKFLEYGGMLHDIGIYMTNAPEIECYGSFPYLAHGYLGRELLEKEGLPHVAPVCERHIGVGISLDDIQKHNLPLPLRDMTPRTPEERLICYADKFYSKSARDLSRPKPLKMVRKAIRKYGNDKWDVFKEMIAVFGLDCVYE